MLPSTMERRSHSSYMGRTQQQPFASEKHSEKEEGVHSALTLRVNDADDPLGDRR